MPPATWCWPRVGVLMILLLAPAAPLDADEAARDRAYAAEQFAAAAGFAERGDSEAALRGYQRAWRWDPDLLRPSDKIVPLALRLGRVGEAVRYALLDLDALDDALVRRIALHLVEQQEWADALRLYRRMLAKANGDRESFAGLLTRAEGARLEYLIGDFKAASRSFEVVQRAMLDDAASGSLREQLGVAIAGSEDTAWDVLGRSHLQAGRLPLAREAFNQMTDSPPAAPLAGCRLAEIDAREGRPLIAYERLRAYFDSERDDPLGAEPYTLLRRLLVALSDHDGLVSDLERLAQADRPHAVAALAEVLAERGDHELAEQRFRSLVDRPETDELLVAHAADWLIRRFAAESRLVDLASLLSPLGDTLEDFALLEEALGEALDDNRQTERLLNRLDRGDTEERSPGGLRAAAWFAREAGRLPLAERLHRAAIAKSGDDAPRRALAWAIDLLLDNQPQQAADTLQWGIDQSLWGARDGAPHFYLATSLSIAEQHDAALAAAIEAAQREPDSPDIAARVPWVLFNADRTDEAIAEYRQILEQFGDDPDPATRDTLKNARLTLSYLTLEAGDAALAVELLEQVLDEFPGDPGALNDLAYLWARRGEHPARAERMAAAAVAAEPDSAAYLDTLAWAQFRRGAAATALETVLLALDLAEQSGEPPDGEILDHWGDILAALDREEEAKAAWRRAAEQLAEDNPKRAEEVRQKLTP